MDYLSKLLLAISKVRPWNAAVILPEDYAIYPVPCFSTTPDVALLRDHTSETRAMRRARRPAL